MLSWPSCAVAACPMATAMCPTGCIMFSHGGRSHTGCIMFSHGARRHTLKWHAGYCHTMWVATLTYAGLTYAGLTVGGQGRLAGARVTWRAPPPPPLGKRLTRQLSLLLHMLPSLVHCAHAGPGG